MPIKQIYDRWISGYATHAMSVLGRLKADVETEPSERRKSPSRRQPR
jgi:hypothetical protein